MDSDGLGWIRIPGRTEASECRPRELIRPGRRRMGAPPSAPGPPGPSPWAPTKAITVTCARKTHEQTGTQTRTCALAHTQDGGQVVRPGREFPAQRSAVGAARPSAIGTTRIKP